ncbi:DUF167 family protein [Dehalococcoidia bacterium]|nr:DUF167 family protein [Dehalococcoidia bacterium]
MIESFLSVKAQTKARVNEIVCFQGNTLRVKVTAAPEMGRANVAIINLVAGALSLPKGSIAIVRGMKSKSKLFRVQGMDALAIRIKLRSCTK